MRSNQARETGRGKEGKGGGGEGADRMEHVGKGGEGRGRVS